MLAAIPDRVALSAAILLVQAGDMVVHTAAVAEKVDMALKVVFVVGMVEVARFVSCGPETPVHSHLLV
jgi:hypothetical protein